jgi:hypothetical protein
MSNEAITCPTTPADQGVEIKGPIDGFGRLSISEDYPILQYSWQYNLINAGFYTTTLTGSGAVSATNSMCVVDTTAATSSTAEVKTRRKLKYRPGQGINIFFTALFTTGKTGSTQEHGWGSTIDSVAVGYNGTAFGILYRNNSIDTWTAQSSFNIDKLDGTGDSGITLDPTKVNIYMIQVPYLGAADISFYIRNATSNNMLKFHRIPITNTLTGLSLKNPSLPIYIKATNTTNNTSIVVKAGCWAGFLSGPFSLKSALERSIFNTKSAITTETNVLTIRNNSTFNSETNLTEVFPKSISIAVDGTKNTIIRVYHNATIGGTPSYTAIENNVSCVSYDTAGTTVTGGHIETIQLLAKTDSILIDLSLGHTDLQPGDTLTVACQSTGSTECTAAIVWREDF